MKSKPPNNLYDIILVGGGAAGLSFAFRACQEPSLRNLKILIIDPDKKNQNDRTWCFWSKDPYWVDEIAHRRWKQLEFHSKYHYEIYDLGEYEYRMVRGIDFYIHTKAIIELNSNIDFLHGSAEKVIDGSHQATVSVNGNMYHARYVFKGIFLPGEFTPDTSRHHYLKQHFKGWIIRSRSPTFEPDIVTMFDFRTPQKGAMRFVYLLPFSANEALVEYTLFSEILLDSQEYDSALRAYIYDVLQISDYKIIESEMGVIPMTDHPFVRRIGKRVLAIGTPGGLVKPSSGYAFHRILKDTEQIISSMIANNHPFRIPPPPWQYRFFDSTMLNVMKHSGDKMEFLFSQMFKNNNIQRIFHFLDETDSLTGNLPLLLSVNPIPFIQSVVRLYLLRSI